MAATALGACSSPEAPSAVGPSAATSTGASSGASDLSPATVAYLKAWAANDVPTMVGNSVPGSPARGYADYWGRVFDAGRQDTGSAELTLRENSAVLRYPDASYRLSGFEATEVGLITWTSRPGGALADRIVTGPAVRSSVGGLGVTIHEQYVNTEGGLRITLTVRRGPSATAAELAAPRYATSGGADTRASLGSQARTGVVRVPTGRSSALVSVPRAEPGGRLTLAGYRSDGRRVDDVVIDLPG